MTLLAKALVRVWWYPEIALAHARVGLTEARASECPHRIREWGRAVACLEWLAWPLKYDWRPPTLEEIHETMVCYQPPLPRSAKKKVQNLRKRI